MTAEQLAAMMYEAWRKALHDPFAHPAWGNLATEHRNAWTAAAKVAMVPLVALSDIAEGARRRLNMAAQTFDIHPGEECAAAGCRRIAALLEQRLAEHGAKVIG